MFLEDGIRMKIKTDEELFKLIKQANKQAFKTLYERYELGVFNFILRYSGNRDLAQDLLQETFTKIWFTSEKYVQEKGNVKNWIFTIALNITKNEMVKKRYAFTYEPIEDIFYKVDTDENELTDFDDRIGNVLKTLKPDLREIILFKHYQQLKFKEISEITKLPESTLKSRFQKALSELKKHLEVK